MLFNTNIDTVKKFKKPFDLYSSHIVLFGSFRIFETQ